MAKKNDDTIFWVAGILLLLLVVTQQNVNQEEDFSMRINYYKDGVQVFHKNLFSIVTGSYDQISFNIYGTNEGIFNITDMQIVDASPIEFKNALPTTNQTLGAGEINKLLWTSDLINATIFESFPQPVDFWFNISGNAEDVEVVYEEGGINLTIEGGTPVEEPTVSTLINNIIAYFKFDGTSGDVIDSTGSYNGINNGAARGVSGKFGNSFSFSSNDYISFSDNNFFKPLNNFSISVWFKTSSSDGVIFSSTEQVGSPTYRVYGTMLVLNSDGRIKLQVGDSTGYEEVYTTSSLNDNLWHHLVVSVSADGIATIYVDKVIESSGAASPGYLGGNMIYTGVRDDVLTTRLGFFTGLIDELALIDKSVTQEEVNELNSLSYPFT